MNLNTWISKIFNHKNKNTMSEEVKTKMCSHCHRVLPLSMFNKRASNKTDGHQYICRECSRKVAKEFHAKKLAKKQEAESEASKLPMSAEKIVLKDGTVLRKKETVTSQSTSISLSDFSNRQILEELKTRGYVWDNMWVKVTVDWNKI